MVIRGENGAATVQAKATVYGSRGFGGYALADGPDWTSENGTVRFNGSPTASETAVEITFAGIGPDRIRVTATTDATSAGIAGDLDIIVVGLASVSADFSLDK